MTEPQENVLSILNDNGCNISNALDSCGVSLEEFEGFLRNAEFEKYFKSAKQKADDLTRQQLDILCAKGIISAIIEKNKYLRQSDEANESKRIRRDTAAELIGLCDTKHDVLKKFCNIFKCSKNSADDFFKAAITEYGLDTPAARNKKERAKNSRKLISQFEAGELNQESSLRGLYKICLRDAQDSEYPSERKGAIDQSLKIMEFIHTLEDRRKREAEQDNIPLYLKVDALLMSSSPQRVEEIQEKVNAIKHISSLPD